MNGEWKTIQPPSWLAAIKEAPAAFTGKAHLVEDQRIPAMETALRGPGYHLKVEIIPEKILFGSPPDAPVSLEGETARAPDTRLSLDAPYFPPDALRRVPYWEYARSGELQRVLVVMSKPALASLLTGTRDDLPGAVSLIYGWTILPENEQKSAVMADLSKPGNTPVAYVAGFELLIGTTPDLPGLYDSFLRLPGIAGAAIGGIVDELRGAAARLSDDEVKALAWRLLDGWARENDPAALSGYLLWFDQHRQRTWSEDEKMREAVLAQAKRSSTLSFSGPYGGQWEQQVRYYASVL